jgi:uncharacterized membrane protein
MDWLEFGVQWLHVAFAIFWFGGTMLLDFVVLPTLHRVPPGSARDVGRTLAPRVAMLMRVAAIVVITLGIIRGIAWGPRNAAGTGFDFSSQYGMTWSISILLALAIAAINDGVTSAPCGSSTATTRSGTSLRRAGSPAPSSRG